MCHIRKATQGATALHDTHPFRRELGGHVHTFAHNGDLCGIAARPALRLGRFRPVGDTDSEHAFCVLMHRLEALWDRDDRGVPTLAARSAVIAELAAELRPLGPANFLYCDGDAMFAHGHARTQSDGERRPPGLHVLCRTCRRSDEHHELVGLELGSGDDQLVSLVASVPLSDEAWRPLAEGELLVLRDGTTVRADEPA